MSRFEIFFPITKVENVIYKDNIKLDYIIQNIFDKLNSLEKAKEEINNNINDIKEQVDINTKNIEMICKYLKLIPIQKEIKVESKEESCGCNKIDLNFIEDLTDDNIINDSNK